MLDDAADVVERKFRKSRVAVACKEVLSTLPYRLVNVHTGAVIAHDGFGHECRGLAVRVRDHMHRIFQNLHPVSTLDQGVELGADLVLSRRRDFVVEDLDFDALFFQRE